MARKKTVKPSEPDNRTATQLLAERIERAMRLSMGGPESRLYAEDSQRRATSDVAMILRSSERTQAEVDDLRRAFVIARVAWLRAVLDEAMER